MKGLPRVAPRDRCVLRERTMSTTRPTADKATDEELPTNWTETMTTEVARFERDDGAVVRIRTDIPIRSAAKFNSASHFTGTGTVHVLFEDADGEPPETIHEGGTEADGRAAALAFLHNYVCTDHQRELVADATDCLICPGCTDR